MIMMKVIMVMIMNMMITMMLTCQPGQSQMSVCPLWCPLSQWEAEMVANQDFAKAGIISTKTIIPTMRVSITVIFVTIIIVTTVIIPAKTI